MTTQTPPTADLRSHFGFTAMPFTREISGKSVV